MANTRELTAAVIIWLIIYAIKTGQVCCECENRNIVDGWHPWSTCDVEIKTSSKSDQCVPSNGPYCFSLKNEGELREPNGCPLGGPKVECQKYSCNTENKTLEEFAKHLDFLIYGQKTQPNEKFDGSCGPAIVNNSIEFQHNYKIYSQMNCTDTFQPSISLNASGSTLTFSVDLIGPETHLESS